MLVRRRNPFQELFELFDRSLGGTIMESAGFLPNTEAHYRDGHLVIRAELAGVDPQSVDVSVAGRTLTIRGERQAPAVPLDDRLFSEIAYGKFERTVMLPEGLDAGTIKAVWRHGILEITIPAAQALQPKKVPVEIVRA